MNEQLESLIFYIKWLWAQGVSKEELVSQQDCVDYFLNLMALAQPNALYRAHNWSGANEPLPLLAIDLAANFNAAIKEAFTEQNVFVPAKENKHYFEQYAEKECKTGEEKESLIADVESFWKRLNSYMTPQNQRAYGLAVGRVQSGKTRNYIGLMFKAIDEGYNTIIILTSKSNRLAVQTHIRVEAPFNNLNIPNYRPLTNITDKKDGVEWNGRDFTPNQVRVGVIMKNESGHLAKVRDWMDEIGEEARHKMRLLFIDDESDSATPNTNNIADPEINCDEDVERLIRHVLDSKRNGAEQIANWMRSISDAEIVATDIDAMCQHLLMAVSKKVLMRMIVEDADFRRLARLDSIVQISGKDHDLFQLVHDFFNFKATRRQPFNWSVLRDFFNYVFGVRQARSRINHSICELVGQSANEPAVFSYDKMIYVGYTATPFANMLNEDPTRDPLCPDCIKPLDTNSRYFGLQRIFGGEDGACNMDIVRQVSGDEYQGWVQTLQAKPEDIVVDDAETFIRMHNFAEDDQSKDERLVEWTSLMQAVKWAFCTAAARRVVRLARNNQTDDPRVRWTTMLFNLSHLSDQYEGVHPVQQQLLERYIKYKTSKEHREEFVNECMAVWDKETKSFTKAAFEQSCSDYGEYQEYPARDRVREELRDWFMGRDGKVQIIQMNSAVDGNKQKDYNDKNCEKGDVLWFVCGGNAISRGLTLRGLTVSYYDRIKGSSYVDTITQMGRWFGYHEGYELLPRIWMTQETIDEMKRICRVEESLHSELQDLWGVEEDDGNGNRRYPPSLREGQNTASIRYFGRRLSGRDANGMQFDSVASKGVFETVHEDKAQTAFDLARQFCKDRGDTFQWDNPDDRHAWHRLFWKDVKSADIAQFIGSLKEEYFAGPSVYDAEGLFRELADYPGSWNVVVGNPQARGKVLTAVGDEYFEGYFRRNNPIKRESGGIIQLGRKQFTEVALLARVPNKYITAAQKTNPDERIGRQIEKVYELMEKDEGCEDWLKNPTLLIDFVNGDSDQLPLTQVSFYWHGHSQESFFRAVVNPNRPSIIAPVVECLNKQGYASLTHLHRSFGGQLDKKEFKEELDMACRQPNPQIGKVADDVAETACLAQNVYYSTEWMDDQEPDGLSEGEVIGLDLYHLIIRRGWNQYVRRGHGGVVIPARTPPTDGIGWLRVASVSEIGYENVISYDPQHNGEHNRSKWEPFAKHYMGKEIDLKMRRSAIRI